MRATQRVRISILRVVPSFALVPLALASGGCLMEYVLPGDPTSAAPDTAPDTEPDGDDDTSGNTGATGDVPTSGDTSDTPQPCLEGQLRCDEGCVDPSTDEAHCGRCGDPCESDKLCIVGECRDVQVLECEGCPCPDQCPQDEGVLASTTSEGDEGGDSPQQRLCCVVDAAEGAPQVVCVIGDVEDALVCPQGT